MGRKMPSLSWWESKNRCGYDFVIMLLTERGGGGGGRGGGGKKKTRKTNASSAVGLIADFLAGRTGLNKTNDLYYPPLA